MAQSLIEGTKGKTISETLLWTNPNPTSSFEAQLLYIGHSEYDFIKIVFNPLTTSTKSFFSIHELNSSNVFGAGITDSGTYVGPYSRLVEIYTNFRISACLKSGGTITNNSYCIPVEIYGIKVR